MSNNKELVTVNNVKRGLFVIDEDGTIGFVDNCDDFHNIIVKDDGGNSHLYCLIQGCKEEVNTNGHKHLINMYEPLYIASL